MKRLCLILGIIFMMFGCAIIRKNKPFQNLKADEIQSVKIENEYPPFNHYDMSQEDIDVLVSYLNSLNLSSFKEMEEFSEGDPSVIILNQLNDTIKIYCLSPYLCIDSVWYECSGEEVIFRILANYK